MVNRRDFLVTLLFTPLLPACTSSSTGEPGDANPARPCDGAAETSTVAQGHTHSLCVPVGLLLDPLIGGATLDTSTNAGHLHTATLTEAELEKVGLGGLVVITTSLASGHTHDFSVQVTLTQPPTTEEPAPPP